MRKKKKRMHSPTSCFDPEVSSSRALRTWTPASDEKKRRYFLTSAFDLAEKLEGDPFGRKLNYFAFEGFRTYEELQGRANSLSSYEILHLPVKWEGGDPWYQMFSRYRYHPSVEQLDEFSKAYDNCEYKIILPGNWRDFWYVRPLGEFYYLVRYERCRKRENSM